MVDALRWVPSFNRSNKRQGTSLETFSPSQSVITGVNSLSDLRFWPIMSSNPIGFVWYIEPRRGRSEILETKSSIRENVGYAF
jgi:hypothetical protein